MTTVTGGLVVRNLNVAYGRVVAVRGVSFSVPEGSSLGIIGANGAGKSSTLKAIFGSWKPPPTPCTSRASRCVPLRHTTS